MSFGNAAEARGWRLPLGPLAFLLLFVRSLGTALALGSNDVVKVRYGYFDSSAAFNAACGRGWLNLARNVQEDLPAYEVECYPQIVGVAVASRLDNAQLDVAYLGSTPWAEAIARGLDLKEIYVSNYIGDGTGLVVRKNDDEKGYEGIATPRDLENRTIAVPFDSIAHQGILFVIELFGLQGLVNVVNLPPAKIVEAWNDPKHEPFIDGAFCWDPDKMKILASGGRELISATALAHWGCILSVVVTARRGFANEHEHFMRHLVGILSRFTDSFLDNLGGIDAKNVARWSTHEKDTGSFVRSVVDSLMIRGETAASPSYSHIVSARVDMDLLIFHSTPEQFTPRLMGNPGRHSKPTGEQSNAIETGKFLLQNKILSTLGIMDHSSFWKEDSDIIDPTYLAAARRGNNVATPLGPYDGVIYVDNEPDSPMPDPVLGQLEINDINAGRPPFSPHEVGRASGDGKSGDSNCTFGAVINHSTALNGTFGDGANANKGNSYSDGQNCTWTIYPLDGLVEVRLRRLKLWSRDFVRIYSGGVSDCPGNKPRTLLAQLSGFYEDADLSDALPPFRSSTCIVVEFETDEIPERGYVVDENYGDGFEIFYSRVDVPQRDCNGEPWDSDGLCLCGGEAWGGDCSHTSHCLGSTKLKVGEETNVLLSSARATKEALSSVGGINNFATSQYEDFYPNDLDCTYELDFGETSFDVARVNVYYDLEETFDLLQLQTGSGEIPTQHHVLSGQGHGFETFYVPAENGIASLRLRTDDKGRRRGFYAEVSGEHSKELSCEKLGLFGLNCESEHCLHRNKFFQSSRSIQSEYVIGRLMSQSANQFVRAMPWAPGGGCTWEIEPNSESTGRLRVSIAEFDLESFQANAVGDKVIFQSRSGDHLDEEIFVEQCTKGDTCQFHWQTGECIEGACAIRQQIEFDIGADADKTSVLLVTDRNDNGIDHRGIDFDVQYVAHCELEHCYSEGGTCKDGLCTCSDGIACSCSCEEKEEETRSSKVGLIIGLCVLAAVVVLLSVLFLWQRKKKNKTIEKQQSIIAEKQAELEALTVIGNSKFGDSVAFIDSLLKPGSHLSDSEDTEKLRLVKRCLVRGTEDKAIHVPDYLDLKSSRNTFLLKEYAGIDTVVMNQRPSPSVRNFAKISAEHPVRQVTDYCLPEFRNLDDSQQRRLFELLRLQNLQQWSFNVFDVAAIDEESTLLFVAWAVICSPQSQVAMAKELSCDPGIDELDGYHFLDLDIEELCDYLRLIQQDYKADNPYHNAIHAADVVQTVHALIQMTDKSFDREQVLSILVASAVHDVNHPGKNNSFQVNSFSELALNHNDESVLENEHSAHAFKLMFQGHPGETDGFNFLGLNSKKFGEFRKRIIESVLHTDMSRHFITVDSIKSLSAGKSWDEIELEVRWKILMFMLHLADISNPAKADPVFLLWTDRCLEEFFSQGDKEREMGLPISPNCDRRSTKKPDSQIGFIKFVILPAYEVLADIFPLVGENILPVIRSNLKYWEGEKMG